MPTPRPNGRVRAEERRAARRVRRFAALTLVAAVTVVTLLLTAFGAGSPERVSQTAPAPPQRLLTASRPLPEIVAVQGPLRLQLPVAQSRLTAIGYHSAGTGALPLEPLGTQGNRGLLGRLADRIFGATEGDLVYYRLEGSGTSTLDVGAAPDTDVFAPVDGTIVGITPFVLNGKRYGVRVDVQPATAPSLVVSVTRLRPDAAITVGSSVAAGTTRLGAVLDLAGVERMTLARYPQDAGNHVSLEVRPAATTAVR